MFNTQEIAKAVAAIGMALLSACSNSDPTPHYRFRMTVEVETPEGLKTGSSVIEVETSRSKGIPTDGTIQHRVHGEAVAVDLDDGKVLFALLRSPGNIDWPGNVMFMLAPAAPPEAEDPFQWRFDTMLAMREPITLPERYRDRKYERGEYAKPMLVTFGNLDDPTSIDLVDPENLAATFGEGYALRRITVQLTDEPITTGIEERLAWLENLEDYRTIPDNPFSNTLPREIASLRLP